MTRILVLVEGQTEEQFVNDIIAPHLTSINYRASISARLMGRARQRGKRGGVKGWTSVQEDITRHFRGDRGVFVTTLVDFYAMPQTGDDAWPGRAEANGLAHAQKGSKVESEMLSSIINAMDGNLDPRRFFPFVFMYEFEALLFSDCAALSRGIYQPHLQIAFQNIRNQFSTPEEINDSPLTAPSKRILNLVPEYQKPLYGILAITEIGLGIIRNECPHFASWLSQLESWAREEGN